MPFILNSGINTLKLSANQTLKLELGLNVSTKGNLPIWKEIGDRLYAYHTGKGKGKNEDTMEVSDEQFVFFSTVLKKGSWEQCRGL